MTLFHFDLRHVEAVDGLRVSVHEAAYDLQPHDTHSLRAAADAHPVLSALPAEARQSFTHFADVDDGDFHEGIRWVRVERPRAPGVYLSEVVLMTQHLPESYLRAYYLEQFRRSRQPLRELQAFYRAGIKAPPRLHSGKLAALGLTSLPADEESALDMLLQTQKLVTSLDTAAGLVAHHPDLANVQPYTATVVLNDHILPDPDVDPDQYNAMQTLARAIANPKNQPWSPVIECKDKDGNPLKAEYELGDGDDGFKPGEQLYTYGVADPVKLAMSDPTGGALKTAANDTRLENKVWSPTPGTTTLVHDGSTGPGPTALSDAPRDAKSKWTVDERTDHHGISVDQGSIRVDESDNFSINANNSYLRTIYVGYQLFDEAGKPVGDARLLTSISVTNTLLGIPVTTDPTSLDFNLEGAASVELYFGSLGTSDWSDLVSSRGALLTCLWQYGVPVIFLVAGKALTSTATFNKIVNDKDLRAAAIAVGFGVVGGGVSTAAALTNTKKVLFSFANVVLGMALKKGMEALGRWLLAQVAAGQIRQAFGPVGWVLAGAAALMTFRAMAVTTGQVLSSPACIKVKVSRSIDVALTLLPDPRHGEAGHPETAVWPSVASRYVVTLQYKGGTNFQLAGDMPDTTSSTPLPLTFKDVPAGGRFRIIAGIYSANGWLAGSWQSDWLEAKANEGTTLQLGEHSITENLVPLAPDAQYVYKERIVYKNDHFSWEANNQPPSTTMAALNCGPAGTVCELVNLTINNSAFQVGYAWRASGQHLPPDDPTKPPSDAQLYALQNLSVLADPGSRLKTSGIGFTNKPGIAYAPSTNATNEIDQTNFIIDPRGGGMNLRQVVLDNNKPDFGLGDPNLPSWGHFPLTNIDAMAVHPSNAVIACSWQDHKLMILNLPPAPTTDDNAPVALLVSGQGIRQGLMQGPKALAVAPDGRILVLESLNQRVQAFDTKGNPVPSFTPGPVAFTIDTDEIADSLDQGQVPEVLEAALRTSGLIQPFPLDPSFVPGLDGGHFQPEEDPLILALSQNGVILAYDPDNMSDPELSAQIEVVQAGKSWIITDPRGMAWQVLNAGTELSVYQRVTNAEIRIETPGQQWVIIDDWTGNAWRLAPSTAVPGHSTVRICLSFFPLRGLRVGSVTYLDMAVEAQGYVYILAYRGDGSQPTDYLLDVYGPDGGFVFRTPDPSVTTTPQNVVAGRIAVDIWRNLYALNFDTLRGPNGDPQPGLAHWMPTPPLFTLELALQKDFNEQNIGTVSNAFAQHDIHLSNQAFILVVDPEGTWEVKDGTTIYHVYRSGDGLQVYAVPA